MVSSIFNICSCFLYFTELTWLQNKIETTLYTAVSIDIDAYYWDTQGVATFFHGVKCPRYRDLKKGQIPAHPGLNSCQIPGGCPGGGMGTLGLIFKLQSLYSLSVSTKVWLGHPHLFLCFSSIWFAKVGLVGRQKKIGQNVQRHEIKAY